MKFTFQPMLAATIKDVATLQFPLIATPKLDGIRCSTLPVDPGDGECRPVCRSLKPVPNEHVYESLQLNCPPGLDGELMTRDNDGNLDSFHNCQGKIMRHQGEPDFEFHIFDYLEKFEDPRYAKGVMTKYLDRLRDLSMLQLPKFCKYVMADRLHNLEELEKYEAACLKKGYEGVMLRTPHSAYKFGRSTLNEQWLMKLKRFEDSEAKIIGFEERLSNQSPQKDDPLGRMRRHSFQEHMVPTNSLGALVVLDCKTGVQFNLGSGFTEEQRVNIWDDRNNLLGKVVTYKHQPHGQKDKPRSPIFLGFRNAADIS